jgi:hypothetical protein
METTQSMGGEPSFEKVWANIQTLVESQKETTLQMKETDRRMQETDRIIQETAQQMKETDRRVGELTNRFGEIVEYMVIPNLLVKFKELGLTFTKAYPDAQIADYEHRIFTEVDAFLENGDKVMIVEIKTKPNSNDIDYHLERMGKLRAYADLRNDQRKYLGAVAGVIISESVKTYALKNGFYVIEPSGETFVITEPKDIYRPREW